MSNELFPSSHVHTSLQALTSSCAQAAFSDEKQASADYNRRNHHVVRRVVETWYDSKGAGGKAVS